MARVRLVAAVLITSVALAACGGGSSSKALSKAEYQKQTNLACSTFRKDLSTAVAKFDPKKASSYTPTATKLAAVFHQAADDLRKVGYPTGLKDEANAFYDGLDKAGDKLLSSPDVLKSKTEPKEFADLASLAKKAHITTCGSG